MADTNTKEQYTYDVFISYSSIDKEIASTVCSFLEENGLRCWIAPRDITPGTAFAEAIIDGIKACRVFVLIYSSNSNHSSQVIKEVDRAVHHGLSIINIRLNEEPLSKKLEYYISDVHWLDAINPPLEQHFAKLHDVIRMLLKMDGTDDRDIDGMLHTAAEARKETGKPAGKTLQKLLLPVVVIVLAALAYGTLRFAQRRADIRWAREEALPEIEQMIAANDVWRNLVEPYQLAEKAEAVLGKDSLLEALFSQCARYIDVVTDPPGTKVYMKEYVHPEAEWTFLGTTPLDSIRVPVGIFRWMLVQEGYDTVFAAASTWGIGGTENLVAASDLVRTLFETGRMPEGMVHVPETETETGAVGDFFISRYEVTNRAYKEFLDAGGYRNPEYWKFSFVQNGQELDRNEAMALFVDQSGRPGPGTWIGGDYPQGEGNFPVSGISWYEAVAYAEWKGMSLPTSVHWEIARGGYTPMIQVPQLGGFGIFAPYANFGNAGPVAVGSLSGLTAYGAFDMPGNVREWCWNESDLGKVIRGGSWEDNTYEFGNLRQAPAMDRSPRNGIRLAFYPDSSAIPFEAFAPVRLSDPIELQVPNPVPDEIFQVFRSQFDYDPSELNALVEYHMENPGRWVREKVSFNAAYGDERVTAYLFLPDNVSPPYQTVIYFPGSASTYTPTSQDIEHYYEFPMFLSFLVANGRAVMYPVYKGTFERWDPALVAIHSGENSHAYTGLLVQLVKDFRRCLDYLETRTEIDNSKLAFYGMSWGGAMGAVIPAVEDRLVASVLLAGGLNTAGRPEANAVNYVTRVRIPTLLMNGKYDSILGISIQPLFDLLGTAPEDKKIILYDTDHIPPRTEYVKETLAWLDKYLGPVR